MVFVLFIAFIIAVWRQSRGGIISQVQIYKHYHMNADSKKWSQLYIDPHNPFPGWGEECTHGGLIFVHSGNIYAAQGHNHGTE